MREILNTFPNLARNSNHRSHFVFPVIKVHKKTEAAEQIPWNDSPFSIVDVNTRPLIRVKRKYPQNSDQYNYLIAFEVKVGTKHFVNGQGARIPFSLEYNPGEDLPAYIDGRIEKGFNLNLSTCYLVRHLIPDSDQQVIFGQIDGEALCPHLIITSKDSIDCLNIFQSKNRLLDQPKRFQVFSLEKALQISRASLNRLKALESKKIITQDDRQQAKKHHYFIWASLWIHATYHMHKRTRVNSYIDKCTVHCNTILQRCLSLENQEHGPLIKRGVEHIRQVHIALYSHLQNKPYAANSELDKLLTKKIEPSLCDCSPLFWNRCKALCILSGVATVGAAVITATLAP